MEADHGTGTETYIAEGFDGRSRGGRLTLSRQRRYFALDPERSGPYDLAFSIKAEAADAFETDLSSEEIRHVLETAQASSGPVRTRSKAAARPAGRIKILTEGDSWFKLPDLIADYPPDVVDFLAKEFDVRPLAMWRDTLENIVENPAYKQILDSGLYRHFLLSAGGNDILGSIDRFVTRRRPGDTSPGNAASYLRPSYRTKIAAMMRSFETVVRETRAIGHGGITLYVHGYGNAIPRKGQANLGLPFEALGFDPSTVGPVAEAIVADMVATFNAGLKTLAASHANVVYLDLRGVLKAGDWHTDEIHPSASGARKVAKAFGTAIRRNEI